MEESIARLDPRMYQLGLEIELLLEGNNECNESHSTDSRTCLTLFYMGFFLYVKIWGGLFDLPPLIKARKMTQI